MPSFEYQQRDRSGRIFQGQIEAASLREASLKLRDEGLFLTSLKPVVDKKPAAPKFWQWQAESNRVKLRDLLLFTKQFAVMIRAGMNLNACLNLLSEQITSPYLIEIVNQTKRSIEDGDSLHVALGKFPKVFTPMYIHLVEAGEASGQLDTVLDRVAGYIERNYDLRRKVINSVSYPCFIAVVAVAAVFLLMLMVVPQFITVFRNESIQLPFITRILIWVSGVFQNYWYLLIGAMAGGVFGVKLYYDSRGGRKKIDIFLYHAKLIGPVVRQLAAANFTRTFGMLLESGITVTTSLEIVERAVSNAVIVEAVNTARTNIAQGGGIAAQLAETKAFAPMVTQLIAAGEETGELSVMLNEIANFYEKEAAGAIEALTRLIEPAIIIAMGVVIGMIVAAIYIPIFSMVNMVR